MMMASQYYALQFRLACFSYRLESLPTAKLKHSSVEVHNMLVPIKHLHSSAGAHLNVEFRSRGQFIPRLRNAVRWLNSNSKVMLELCANQKERCAEVLRLKGARTRF